MRVLIVSDSFKESLSATEVAAAIARGLTPFSEDHSGDIEKDLRCGTDFFGQYGVQGCVRIAHSRHARNWRRFGLL